MHRYKSESSELEGFPAKHSRETLPAESPCQVFLKQVMAPLDLTCVLATQEPLIGFIGICALDHITRNDQLDLAYQNPHGRKRCLPKIRWLPDFADSDWPPKDQGVSRWHCGIWRFTWGIGNLSAFW